MIDHPLVRDLLKPENLPRSPDAVEFKSTHASFVFLAGDDVYKIKRAKDYGFFNYTTLDARRGFCEDEVRLNRRTAPDVYLGVLPVYRDAKGHSMTRPGEIVDYAVHMRRLPDDRNARALLRAGRLTHDDLDSIARRVAQFYREAEVRPDPHSLRTNIEENFSGVEPYLGRFVDPKRFEETRAAQLDWLGRTDLSKREARDGHGDLRLEHVYLLPQVILIDCIEFLDRFRIADPALDVAFLAMDLHRERHEDLAEYLFGRFAYEADDYDFYPLVDAYVSYRAWVRGKVACFVAGDPKVDPATARRKATEASDFFELAHRAMRRPPRPRIIAIGGLIGSGKTTVAEAVARRTAATVVSADATRKHMAGLGHAEKAGPEAYTPEFTTRVQNELIRRATVVLSSGRPVILDTTFSQRSLRARARKLADQSGAPFLFIECTAPEATIRSRLQARRGGVSDAREDLYASFRAGFEPVDELPSDEHVTVDTSQPLSRTLSELLS